VYKNPVVSEFRDSVFISEQSTSPLQHSFAFLSPPIPIFEHTEMRFSLFTSLFTWHLTPWHLTPLEIQFTIPFTWHLKEKWCAKARCSKKPCLSNSLACEIYGLTHEIRHFDPLSIPLLTGKDGKAIFHPCFFR